jgi:carbon monoxide dehydrogenase subunit G
MEMSNTRIVPAPRDRVWRALNDTDTLKASVPGCETLERVEGDTYRATVAAKVGPVSARFSGKLQLLDIDAPNGYRLKFEGQGGAAGFANGEAKVTLADAPENQTSLSYAVKAQVGGKLAQIGARLVDATARQMADEFFGNFATRVGGAPAVAVPAGVDERGEEADVADLIADPEVTAEAVEERIEAAAERGFLGGPYMWGLIALIIVIALLLILR